MIRQIEQHNINFLKIHLLIIIKKQIRMLSKIKKGKKQTKADKKANNPKEQPTEDAFGEEDEKDSTLVDIQAEQQQKKPKQVERKRNKYELQQKKIDLATIAQKKPEKPKQRTTWVANTVEEVTKQQFKMEKIDHEFISLTDQKLNQQLQAKRKEEQEKQKKATITFQNNMNLQKIQKTPDQLKMEKIDDKIIPGNKFTPVNTSITPTGPPVTFTNSSLKAEFKPLQKTVQELKMQEAERRRQQQLANKPVSTSWIGVKKTNPSTTQTGQKPAFKTSPWVLMATQNQQSGVGDSVKFAPLNKVPEGVVESNGYKFAPLKLSTQQQKMNSRRNQPELVFVSKKEQEQRRKKRQQKEREEKARAQKAKQQKI